MVRPFYIWITLSVLLSWPVSTRGENSEIETTVDLLTMSPGDHLWTRFGHTALMVMKKKRGFKKYTSTVYNYGDADFEAPGFAWRFFRGTAKFRIAVMGTLNETVTLYARMNRTISHQRLNLSKAQIKRLVTLLKENVKPENREYDYHHLTASCATKVRDILDMVLGGEIKKQLAGQLDPHSVRYYARLGYAGHLGAEVANDLWMGRLHDKPQTKWFSMFLPERLSTHLQQIKVPDPKGDKKLVPLVGKPHVMFKRRGPPATAGEGRTLIHLTYVWIVLVLGLGIYALLGLPDRSLRAGLWLLLWALPMGLASGAMVFGALFSTVIEGRINELLIAYPVTDLLLIGVAFRWTRGRAVAGRFLRGYAIFRVGLVVLSLIGHATGLLYQEPRVLVVLALVSTVMLVLVSRRLPMTWCAFKPEDEQGLEIDEFEEEDGHLRRSSSQYGSP